MNYRIVSGDVSDALAELDPASFDACLTDPPYGLSDPRPANSATPRQSSRERIRGGFMGMKWDAQVPAADVWSAVHRVLKPGAHLLAFGGTRTFHRLACAIDDAGFEIRDCLMWLYGSGFPKSLDISKAIDKAAGVERGDGLRGGHIGYVDSENGKEFGVAIPHCIGKGSHTRGTPVLNEAAIWSGYGTALKPAWEPIILAMKACDGTFARNALEHGVAGINVDAGRIGCSKRVPGGISRTDGSVYGKYGTETGDESGHNPNVGRWPANLILDDVSAAMLDEQSGELISGANPERRGSDKFRDTYSAFAGQTECIAHRGQNSGGASRFFYIAKADSTERHAVVKNVHPTVKPIDLAAYLAKLLLPPKRNTPRRLLVPFCGSGSEIIGALRAGWDEVVGVEIEPKYIDIARIRIQADAPLLNQEQSA